MMYFKTTCSVTTRPRREGVIGRQRSRVQSAYGCAAKWADWLDSCPRRIVACIWQMGIDESAAEWWPM